MAVEDHLYNRLNSQVAGLGGRIYPNKLPQKPTLPAVRYARVATERQPAMGSNAGLVRATFQFDVYDSQYSGARSNAELVRAALDRYSGTNAPNSEITALYVVDEEDSYESSSRLHRVRLDAEVWYRE